MVDKNAQLIKREKINIWKKIKNYFLKKEIIEDLDEKEELLEFIDYTNEELLKLQLDFEKGFLNKDNITLNQIIKLKELYEKQINNSKKI